jgi:hypothetical protein
MIDDSSQITEKELPVEGSYYPCHVTSIQFHDKPNSSTSNIEIGIKLIFWRENNARFLKQKL